MVLYTQPDLAPADLWQRALGDRLPKLWLPKRENIYQVEACRRSGPASWICGR